MAVAPPEAASKTLGALRSGTLADTTSLSLAGLGLREVPTELRGLSATLEVLDLAGNQLSDLPHWLAEFGHLRVMFGSANPFAALPPVLGACPALSQIGFRGCGIRHVPPEALPARLRWLTLTDNAIDQVPPELGDAAGLRKLLLAGNRLRALPDALQEAKGLELLRISANAFDTLPGWLPRLPRMAWLAWGGNPAEPSAPGADRSASMAWDDLAVEARLGEGSSGEVFAAGKELAVKLFMGEVSSDGLIEREIEASLAAGMAQGLIGTRAELSGHPAGRRGLVMRRIPDRWQSLAAPPSPASCTRDFYAPERRFTPAQIRRTAADIGTGLLGLHAAGYAHGDLYGHNILFDPVSGAARLGDMGAASRLPADRDWRRPDAHAWTILIEELLDRCTIAWPEARALVSVWLGDRASMPDFAEAVATFCRLGGAD